MKMTQAELPLRVRSAYGLGSVGELVFLGMFNTFITIFYNQAIGLSNSLIGTAIMLSLLGDAISDPVIGMISDRWRSRLGRRHPFLFAAPVPAAISLYMIFAPPTSLVHPVGHAGPDQALLFVWLCFWTIVSRVMVTVYVIPHFALGGELTRNANERSRLFSMNAAIGYVTAALFGFVAWGVFLAGKSVNNHGVLVPKHLNAESYGPLVLFACALILGSILISAWGTVGQVPRLRTAPADQGRASLKLYYHDFATIMKNRNYLFLMLGFFFFMISVGLIEALGVFTNTYVWELRTDEMRWIGILSVPAIIVGTIISPALMRRFERRSVLLAAILGAAITAQLPVDLRLAGLFPANHAALLLPMLMLIAAITSASVAVATIAVLSMLGEICDENELLCGLRQEGLIYSARAFFAKASNSVGHFSAGLLLDGYVHMPFGAVPGQLASGIIFKLALTSGPIMGLGALIAVPFYARFRLTRAEHDVVLRALQTRAVRTPIVVATTI